MTDQNKPLISVVMPSYNHAAFIGQAVESVLAQSCKELELIVVDNNSSDNTDDVLAGFRDPRLKVVKYSNGGVIAASRNRGIKDASGEYVAFIDSDDVWLPGKLAAQLGALRANPSAAMAYSRFRLLSGKDASREIYPKEKLCKSGHIFNAVYSRQFLACSGVIVRKAALDAAGGFDESPELFAVEDTDLWIRLSAGAEALLSSREPLFLYRVHAGASSGGYCTKYRRTVTLLLKNRGEAGPLLLAKSLLILAGAVLKSIFTRI